MLPPAVTHDEACALLPNYAAGVLETNEAARVRAHAVDCPDCLHDLFSRPVGLARTDVVDHPPPLPPGRQRAAGVVIAVVLGLGGLGAWAASAFHRREARPVLPPAVADVRIPALESQRTKALARLAKAKRELGKARREAWRPPEGGAAETEAEREAALNGRDAPPAGAMPVEEKPARVIRYEEDEDAVSVRVDNVAVGEVLEEIGRQSGAVIRGQLLDERPISVEFEDVPTADALHRLLGKQNFMLVYDDQDRLHAVELFGGLQESPRAVVAPAPRPETVPSPSASLDAMLGLLQRHPPVALWGDLATSLRADAMPLRLLIETGLHHQEQSVRAAAMRASVEAFEADPELRSAAVGALASMEDKTLAELVQSAAGEHAEEALFYVATRASGELRIKAANVLERLHGQTRGSG